MSSTNETIPSTTPPPRTTIPAITRPRPPGRRGPAAAAARTAYGCVLTAADRPLDRCGHRRLGRPASRVAPSSTVRLTRASAIGPSSWSRTAVPTKPTARPSGPVTGSPCAGSAPASRRGAAGPAGAAAGPGCAPARRSPGRGSSPCPGARPGRSSRPRPGSCGGRSRSPAAGRPARTRAPRPPTCPAGRAGRAPSSRGEVGPRRRSRSPVAVAHQPATSPVTSSTSTADQKTIERR